MPEQSAAEIKRRMEEIQRTVVQLTEAMKLRQWAVERAIEALSKGTNDNDSVVHLAERIFTFVHEPAAQAIEQAKGLM